MATVVARIDQTAKPAQGNSSGSPFDRLPESFLVLDVLPRLHPLQGAFLQRLGRLEEIARSFKGVREAYAVRAGKEVRVIVSADDVSDKETLWLSKDIAGRIEKEIDYPGQLRVSVIRETRSVDFAM